MSASRLFYIQRNAEAEFDIDHIISQRENTDNSIEVALSSIKTGYGTT